MLQSEMRTGIFRLLMSAAYIFVTALLLLAAPISGTTTFLVAPLIAVIVLLSCIVVAQIWSNQLRPVLYFFCFYFLYGLLVPSIYQLSMNKFPWPSFVVYNELLIAQACGVVVASVVAGLIGYRIGMPRDSEKVQAASAPKTNALPSLAVLAVLSVAAAAICLAAFGPGVLFESRGEASAEMRANKVGFEGYFLSVARAMAITFLTVALVALRFHWNKNRGPYLWMVAIALGVAFFVNFPLSLARFQLLGFLLAVLLAVDSRVFRAIVTFSFVGPVLGYIAAPLIDQLTRTTRSRLDLELPELATYMTHGDVDGFQSVMNAIHYVHTEGLQWGYHLFSSILFWVPRGLWWDKAAPVGQIASAKAGYYFTNISMPLPGELFSDFGYLGVVMGMLLLGAVAGRLDKAYDSFVSSKESTSITLMPILAIVLSAYLIILLRGSLQAVISIPFVAVVTAAIWWWSIPRDRAVPTYRPSFRTRM